GGFEDALKLLGGIDDGCFHGISGSISVRTRRFGQGSSANSFVPIRGAFHLPIGRRTNDTSRRNSMLTVCF
ncbi:MAG: hypothetical protein WD275_07245, partial [Rhodothermales bacterium]